MQPLVTLCGLFLFLLPLLHLRKTADVLFESVLELSLQ